MKAIFNKVIVGAVLVSALALVFSSTAFAHVTIKPGEVLTAGFQTFTVSVPNEKEISTVSVKVLIPSDVNYVTPTQKSGWEIIKETEGTGDEAVVKSITWQGGTITDGLRDEFTFSAQAPNKNTELQWKAYQTYADGTVVSWDKAEDGGHGEGDSNSGPFSVTKVISDASEGLASTAADKAAADANKNANTALYVAIAGLFLGFIGIFLATRKK